jgi:hypothetical protein
MPHFEYFIYGLLGGLSLELFQPYIAKGRLSKAKYDKLLKSAVYWRCTIGLMVGSGLVAWAFNADMDNPGIAHVFSTGIAARSIIRQLLTAKNVKSQTMLGDGEITQRDVFA